MCVWVGENEMRWSRGPRDENIFTPFTSRSHPFLAKNNLNSATILITSPSPESFQTHLKGLKPSPLTEQNMYYVTIANFQRLYIAHQK